MNFKTLSITGLLLLAAAGLIHSFTDWFRAPRIQILAQVRPARMAVDAETVLPVTFSLDTDYRLTRLQVFKLPAKPAEPATNLVWQMVAKSSSPPIRGFAYGVPVDGMACPSPAANPKPLEPRVNYRLLLEAGRYRGSVDFQTRTAADLQ